MGNSSSSSSGLRSSLRGCGAARSEPTTSLGSPLTRSPTSSITLPPTSHLRPFPSRLSSSHWSALIGSLMGVGGWGDVMANCCQTLRPLPPKPFPYSYYCACFNLLFFLILVLVTTVTIGNYSIIACIYIAYKRKNIMLFLLLFLLSILSVQRFLS